ncbi:MAG: hypothetical protein DRQ88_10270 [Epsilonproteobacteria bacterium]|nr:MAG: hypothetical protein DRQ89_03000 [Campylobacterota bacterium]RLA64864.1 MAG: hypothetical protein DRQ88_10270 [Campylobacterota bacterium]
MEFNFSLVDAIKLYRGAYDYYENGKRYCTETFEIFENHQDQIYIFKADILGRAPTGEVLTVKVDYKISKRFAPIAVRVEKLLGSRVALETYNFDLKENIMNYKFISEGDIGETQIQTKHKVHIATPAICTSLLFLKSKRLQNTGINSFVSLVSQNKLNFSKPPEKKGISIERISGTPIDIFISGKRLKCVKYQMRGYEIFSDVSDPLVEKDVPFLDIFLSKHLTIPYRITDPKGNKLFEIKYFNYLVDSGS